MANSELEPNLFLQEQCWHLLALLLQIGYPVSPEHLASCCRFFNASPEFVRYVASLTDSPLDINRNGLLTPSARTLFAIARFFNIRFNDSAPSRKRKSVFEFAEGGRDRKRLAIGDGVQAISFESFADTAGKAVVGRNFSAINFESRTMQGENSMIPICTDIIGESSSCPSPKFEYREADNDAITSMPQGEISGSLMKTNESFFINLTCSGLGCTNRYVKSNPFANFSLPLSFRDPLLCNKSVVGGVWLGKKVGYYDTFRPEYPVKNITPSVDDDGDFKNNACDDWPRESNEYQDLECGSKKGLIDYGAKRETEDVQRVNPLVCREVPTTGLKLKKGIHDHENITPFVDDDGDCKNNACDDPPRESNEHVDVESGSKKGLIGYGAKRETEDVQRVNPVVCGEVPTTGLKLKRGIRDHDLDINKTGRNMVTQSTNEVVPSSSVPKQPVKSILKAGKRNDLHSKTQVLTESLACKKLDNVPKNDQKFIAKQKLKHSRKENMAENNCMTSKVEKKAYPSFDNFTIEEEEGSGGYGTVYHAQRTTDGKRFAIKCPHSNAHQNHVTNERIMLERFGGKSFIIKFEDSFKSDSSDCFVLEHVEHDRPEVLKKEIDISELQWYGYCMFKALACLHKEGVIHRDVKPGNFLFSRKLKKGYLIDFNLAMDLKQKYNNGSKSKPILDASNNIPLPSSSAPVGQDKNLGGSKSLASNKRELDYRKYSELNRHVKQKVNVGHSKKCPDKAGLNLLRAQGTDGSGVTSAKDVTSTMTASAERLREPLFFRGSGRKELVSLAHSMQCAKNSPLKVPSSQRKRVTAPSGKVDGRTPYLTPMPVHSSTVAVGSLRSKGDSKHKREGSCVGTKGFRAPEVLFRSPIQGPKVDIWSAGVTLLYMVIGKSPFTGEPEQNINDIAKLRGSEELWEVAKLHDRETSFPKELLDDQYLQSCDIETWCKDHTKRPEFLEHAPKSLFDLIDKCLTVNPRSRISVEEVLRHEFFTPCNETMRKHRMIRRGLSSETAASTSTSKAV